MRLIFIGAGRLATQLSQALHDKGHHILAVYSRTMASARSLADMIGITGTDDLAALPFAHADAVIMAVKDDALPLLAAQLALRGVACPVFHTAGSIPLEVLSPLQRHGVIYPMQTFSKDRHVDFTRIPFFLEASDDDTLAMAHRIASAVSDNVTTMDSEHRRQLHLAAVFACNFANHCYTLAADILESQGMDFNIMLPLIEETAAKAGIMHPKEAQTGPAVRYDKVVIERQSAMLADKPLTRQLYELMSDSIHQHSTK